MNMNLKKIGTVFLLTAGLLGTRNAQAQTTYEEMEQLTVNEQVTTVITASEPVRMVDISTDKVVGDQPLDNIVRLKPKEAGHEDGEVIAIVTVITERYRTQYALVYTTRLKEAVTDKEILPHERNAYNNPAVSMSTAEMTRFARHLRNDNSLNSPIASISSATEFSKKRDCIPVAPTLPISSLSVSRQQVVFSTSSTSSIAARDVYAQTRSSCP